MNVMKKEKDIKGTEWNDLFFEENIDVDEVIEITRTEIMFTTKGGTVFKDHKNYKDIEIIKVGSDAENVENAIKKLKMLRKSTK